MTKRVLLTGYYGWGNIGDEALRVAAVAGLRAAGFEPLVIAGRDRFRLGKITRAIRQTAGLVLGGGGLLQNATSNRSLYYYLGLIAAARGMRRPVFLIGQGIGPIDGRCAQRLTKQALAKVNYLGVRDAVSQELLARIGVEAVRDGDLFFLNPPEIEPAVQSDPPRIGIALHGKPHLAGWKDLLIALSREVRIVFVPFFPREDRAVAERLSADLPDARVMIPQSVADAQELIASLALIISSRLHPLEFALRAGIPMIAVSAAPKVAAFVAEVASRGGPEIPCVELPHPDIVTALLRNPPPNERFTAVYAAFHRQARAGFERFLTVLTEKVGGKNG